MNNKILFSIIAVSFVGGMFTVAYAGPMLPMITLAGDVTITGDMTCPGCVDSGDLGFGAVNVLNINNDAVRAVHIQDGQVGSAEIDTDAVGSDEIATDAVGGSELSDVVYIVEMQSLSDIMPGQISSSIVPCEIGDRAIGGGASTGSVDIDLLSSKPFTDTWFTAARNNAAFAQKITHSAVCLDITP